MQSKDIEISAYQGEGYKPMVDYESWRVAILKYCDELLPEAINKVQKHDKTDEVFVLLSGKCILFSAGKGECPQEIEAVPMEPLKLYNVKKGVWHTHTLSKDAEVLIIENQDTTLQNSPEAFLANGQKDSIIKFTQQIWK